MLVMQANTIFLIGNSGVIYDLIFRLSFTEFKDTIGIEIIALAHIERMSDYWLPAMGNRS